ncbi:MAG TPA: dihydrofolate reductase family protein [Candidatus Nanopelagicaceae bacterium]|nr:dihydrofolate reductase family protein [Candidatus Nanopelagicaceae bacterium]
MRSLLAPNLQSLDDADLLRLYAYPPELVTPWIRANMVSSIDGSAAFHGKSKGLTNAADRRLFHLLRSLADVVLIGAGSVRAEPYFNHTKQVAVITRSGELPSSFFTGRPPLVITAEALDARVRAELSKVAEVVTCGRHEVEFDLVLELFASRGWLKVLCEGGPSLLSQLNASGLIDEVALTISPLLIGSGTSMLQKGMETQSNFELASLVKAKGNLFARYLAVRNI